MLQSLSIENYALISHLDIEFKPGLTIITGETGAGKSILLGALSLILGQRADSDILRDASTKCIVEGAFNISSYRLQEFFTQNDLDYSDLAMLRREISPNGKSRAFINDSPVNLSLIRELALKLVDIHSQHENLELGSHMFQLKVVDACASNKDTLHGYREAYESYRDMQALQNKLVEEAAKASADIDYYRFQFEQLHEAKLVEGEEKELEQEQQLLMHAEEIRSNLGSVSEIITGEEGGVLNMLKDATSLVQKIRQVYPHSEDIAKRIESTYIELKDIASDTGSFGEKVETDPGRLEFINARLDFLIGMMQKHRVASVSELIRIRDDFEKKINDIASYDFRIEETGKKLEALKEKLNQRANHLSANRKKVIPAMEKQVVSILRELGIVHASFEVKCNTLPDFTIHGIDAIEFLFSANRQVDLQEISKVASGGEISRVMLAIKSLLSQSLDLPSIIFDEIDAGVAGEIAHRMGNMILEMAQHMQVINITHLPQVAAKGQYHFLVYKEDTKTATHTHMRLLNQEERVTEIAKMLSGEELTAAAYQNAKELLGIN